MEIFEEAKKRADEIDQNIIEILRTGKNFRVEAGAGAGKTHSLMKVIDWLERERRKEYSKKGEKVACITYTNAAVDVIKDRLKSTNFINPCTIHNFAWELMKQFQSSLIKAVDELGLLPETGEDGKTATINEIHKVKYELGVHYIRDGILYLYHDDVIKLFGRMLDNAKFRTILGKKYPIILIDEYQDSFRSITDQFLKYFINADKKPQFGFFGDSWQTIYSSMGACGEIISDKVQVINKEVNFRSQQNIIDALNNIRPELPQISASDEDDGRIFVITCDDYKGARQTRYYKDELPEDVLYDRVNQVQRKLEELGWGKSKHKTLMLTHKMLAKAQHYDHLLDILGDHLRDADDEHFLFFMERVEPIYEALKNNESKKLFEALGISRRPIETRENKHQWNQLYSDLTDARRKKIINVLNTVRESSLIGIPDRILYWMELYGNKEDKRELFHGKPISAFYEIQYSEIINAIQFQKPDAEFSTDHGVKGEEYESVFIVMGRGWNNYKFDEVLYRDPSEMIGKDLDNYIRNRNLFYVCCSRAEKNLAILITVPVNNEFRQYLERVFGDKSIFDFTQFIGLN